MKTTQKIRQYFNANNNEPVPFFVLLVRVDDDAEAVIRDTRKMIEAGELVEVHEGNMVLWRLK